MLRKVALKVISIYQKNGGGARLGVECTFVPSCSEYAKEAISRHGVLRGSRIAVRRILRCRAGSFADKVHDPVQ
jgi:putative membrane protein insertion efficiency factor